MDETLFEEYGREVFICPNCESTYFGSSRNPDGTLTRHCHNEGGWCKFTWSDSDDEKYRYVVLTIPITEYEKLTAR